MEHDLEFVKKADVLIILVDMPSFGTAIESFVAKNEGKKIILFSPNPLPTPWPLYFSDFHVKSKAELLETLKKCI
ncbi:MAG: nucleoside 2-deoxyribosyltransferase [Nitrosopumilus sp.]|nr:nucleoside 2-deoxyribosyltransferase [Nitrosopumilus sp.]